jgi:hypothetical protein
MAAPLWRSADRRIALDIAGNNVDNRKSCPARRHGPQRSYRPRPQTNHLTPLRPNRDKSGSGWIADENGWLKPVRW